MVISMPSLISVNSGFSHFFIITPDKCITKNPIIKTNSNWRNVYIILVAGELSELMKII